VTGRCRLCASERPQATAPAVVRLVWGGSWTVRALETQMIDCDGATMLHQSVRASQRSRLGKPRALELRCPLGHGGLHRLKALEQQAEDARRGHTRTIWV
jgi:hypothetical protein